MVFNFFSIKFGFDFRASWAAGGTSHKLNSSLLICVCKGFSIVPLRTPLFASTSLFNFTFVVI
ncbi:hypothetical protein BpHYR1_029919 [Brachionus plicatilis]|uniref:Uncharacterized protein n=1 Tax=Brachionus plicatilis TaxID=10195 RepID=A0A3M7SV86_BRAPC|nr:hypothetical protein BpHYR1_029919 [Brachionus plicatilis]